ncbi:sulfatase [Tomitella fengzijianii]|nr:sulfatase [Tomitella fengzijianii]
MMDRPNIVWIVGEDCPPRFGCYGDEPASTPNIDALAAHAVVFEQAYSAAPVCAPSRFSLLTGVVPEAHGPAHHMRAEAPLPPWMTTYPEVLRALGYYCTNNAKTDYNAAVDEARIWDECSPHGHWRGRGGDQPFLAVFNFDDTHESALFRDLPREVDPAAVRVPAYLPDCEDIRHEFSDYYSVIRRFDGFVGDLVAQLAEDGLTDSTVVLLSSDHGGVNPRSKRHCYEEGLHVPLIVAAPDAYAGALPHRGTRVPTPVSTVSIPATIIEFARGEVPGHMQVPGLTRRECRAEDMAFSARDRMDERYDMVRTVRDARFRYIRNFMPHRPCGQHVSFAWLGAGYQAWEREFLAGRLTDAQRRFFQPRPEAELYDLVDDPDEVVNLAGDPRYREHEERLARALREHMLAVGDNGFLPEGAAAEGYGPSRRPGAYDLARLLDLADVATARRPENAAPLAAQLDDPDPVVRRWAALGLVMLGRQAAPALAALDARFGTETDDAVRVALAEALAAVSPDPGPALDHLVDAATVGGRRPIRLEALSALTALDPRSLTGRVHEIGASAADPDPYIAGAAAYLALRIEGRYTPGTVLPPWSGIDFRAAR